MNNDVELNVDALRLAELSCADDPDPFSHEYWDLHLVALWVRARRRQPFKGIYANAVKAARIDSDGLSAATLEASSTVYQWSGWRPEADGQRSLDEVERVVREQMDVPLYGCSPDGHRHEVSTAVRPRCVVWWSDSMRLTFRSGLPDIVHPEMATRDVLRLWPPFDVVINDDDDEPVGGGQETRSSSSGVPPAAIVRNAHQGRYEKAKSKEVLEAIVDAHQQLGYDLPTNSILRPAMKRHCKAGKEVVAILRAESYPPEAKKSGNTRKNLMPHDELEALFESTCQRIYNR